MMHIEPYLNFVHNLLSKAGAKMEPWDVMAAVQVSAANSASKDIESKNLVHLQQMFARRNLLLSPAMARPRNGCDFVFNYPEYMSTCELTMSNDPEVFMSHAALGVENREESWWVESAGKWCPPVAVCPSWSTTSCTRAAVGAVSTATLD